MTTDDASCNPPSTLTTKAASDDAFDTHQLAMDFSTVTAEQFEAFPLPGDAWDTYKVYFNEFPTEHQPSEADAFQPFDVASEAISPKPLTESELSLRSVDDHLDPLGWPYKVEELLFHDEIRTDTDDEADDGNLLAGTTHSSQLETLLEMEKAKQVRLAQYAVVRLDEASLADQSSSDESDEDSVAVDEEDIGYQSQEDEEDSASVVSLRQKLRDSGIHFAANECNAPPAPLTLAFVESKMQQRPLTGAAEHAPEDDSKGHDRPTFNVTWDTMDDETGGAGAAVEQMATGKLEQVPVPLLRPPPQERLQKWLNEKAGR